MKLKLGFFITGFDLSSMDLISQLIKLKLWIFTYEFSDFIYNCQLYFLKLFLPEILLYLLLIFFVWIYSKFVSVLELYHV